MPGRTRYAGMFIPLIQLIAPSGPVRLRNILQEVRLFSSYDRGVLLICSADTTTATERALTFVFLVFNSM